MLTAAERLVARELGLMGASEVEAAQVDAYCEHIRDIREAYGKAKGNPFAPPTEETKAALNKWFDEDMPSWCENHTLERFPFALSKTDLHHDMRHLSAATHMRCCLSLPCRMSRLELATGPSGFAVGSSLSLADVSLFVLLTQVIGTAQTQRII